MASGEQIVDFIRVLEQVLGLGFLRLLPFFVTLIRPGFHTQIHKSSALKYEGWNFNSGNYLFTTDTK